MKSTILLLACLFTSYAHAEVYKWIDENDHTHYSGIPPTVDHRPISLDSCDKKCTEQRNHEAKLVQRRLKDWDRWQNKIEKIRQKSYRKNSPDATITNKTVNPTFY